MEFKEAFDGLEEFRIVRNDMAHEKGNSPTPFDLSTFRIALIQMGEDCEETLIAKDYTKDYIRESIDRFAKINGDLSALWFGLQDEYESNFH